MLMCAYACVSQMCVMYIFNCVCMYVLRKEFKLITLTNTAIMYVRS